MPKVSVNMPKTPVTEDSNGVAAATLPNVCKMPGPPAPFVPTPLPNIGKSGTDPKNYSKGVTIEGKKVAIRGATFGSMGDMASKGTGGGVVSSNVEGPTSFVGPGSMDVKIEGKNVQLLGDPMLNNCGPSGSPANAATMMGLIQPDGLVTAIDGKETCPLNSEHAPHGPMGETPQTKTDASALASEFAAVLAPKKSYLARMLGVVHCKCGKKKYADHSNVTLHEFYAAVENLNAPWRSPPGVLSLDEFVRKQKEDEEGFNAISEESMNRVRESLRTRHANAIEVEDNWALAEKRTDDSLLGQSDAAAYPPGSCAAQKAIVFVWEDGAYPGALTEQWFHTKKGKTKGRIKFLDARMGEAEEKVEAFGHGESVPPCGSCELILPLMLCPGDEEPKCNHKD
ncbi:DUF4150 domain-containing protein [Archangium gephyra]|nr:DUF4150 domain-containing protein [Archangium gephyra]